MLCSWYLRDDSEASPRKERRLVRLERLLDKIVREEGLFLNSSGAVDETEITGLAYHSAKVRAGDLFLCLPGQETDGHLWAQDAVSRGARALLVQRPVDVDPRVPQLVVSDSRRAAALVADVFFDRPTSRLALIGVTGTSGKTPTAHLIRHLLETVGISTGLVGTVGSVIAGRWEKVELTTPEAVDLQGMFHRMVSGGDRACVMEVSSHSLVLHRVDGCAFNVGVFTNLAPEHLDFHADMEDYLHAKAQLFRMLGSEGLWTGEPRAVINADDERAERIRQLSSCEAITYGLDTGEVTARDIEMTPEQSRFKLVVAGQPPEGVVLNLPGRFNIYNALAAAAAASALGVQPGALAEGLSTAEQVAGRFEIMSSDDDDIVVIVDFAHTADELENLLDAVRMISSGEVIVAFGCGGDRDRSKRPVMGAIAEELAERVIVTTDNPRSEDPAAIAEDVLEGMRDPSRCEVHVDRREAIARAVEMASPGDIVVLAGKGHETVQVFAHGSTHFDDRQEARAALQARRERRDGRDYSGTRTQL